MHNGARARRPAFLLLANPGPITGHPLVVEDLRARGLASLLITDELPNGPAAAAFTALERIEIIDSEEHSAILARVARWAADYDIRGVLCLGESFVEPAGIAADLLGLPFPGLRAARVCRNKHLQRLYLADWSPRAQLVTPERRDAIASDLLSAPAILKPLDRFCSSGVQEVAGRLDLMRRLREYRPDEPLLLEAMAAGREVSVEALVQLGAVVFASVTAKRTDESGQFVEMAHTVPCGDLPPGHAEAVLDVNARVIARLGLEDGVTHAEYRVTPEGDVALIEIACRAPGDGIIPLYHLATLRPIERELVRCALGEPVEYPAPVRVARQVYLDHPLGRLLDVQVSGLDGVTPFWVPSRGRWPVIQEGREDDPPTLRHVLVLKPRGTVLTELRDSFDRAVTFFIDAATPEELDQLEKRVRSSIRIVTEAAA